MPDSSAELPDQIAFTEDECQLVHERCNAESENDVAIEDMNEDEKMVYSCIKSADTAGILYTSIRSQTKLSVTVTKRVLETLESNRFIKRVKNHQHPRRKMYMLYDLTPNMETPWYTEDSEFDADFVNSLSSALEQFIASKSWPNSQDIESIHLPSYSGYPTAQDAHEWLSGRGVTDVKLSIADIVALLDVLIYDGKIEKRRDGLTYKSVKPLVDKDGPHALTDMPCGLCPVFDVCEEGGAVSPEGCPYWQEWLEREQ